MDLTIKEKEEIKQYLLGTAPEAGLSELEERILSDDSFYEELLIAEDELIDQYLSGALSEPERSGFVSHFLITDERREKLRFSRTLRKYLNAEQEQNRVFSKPSELLTPSVNPPQRKWFSILQANPIFQLSLSALSLIVVFGLSWVVLNNRSQEKPPGNPESVFLATLSPGLTRDLGQTAEISIPPGKDMVRLQLQLESSSNGYQSFSAELEGFENNTLLKRDKLQPEVQNAHRLVMFDVPAQILKVGYYQVKLSGVADSGITETVGRYPFKVVK